MNNAISSLQSFCAMHFFLEDYFYATSSDSIGALLSCMQFLNDGETADPVLWQDWCEIVGDGTITSMQAFQAMSIFLGIYFQQTSSYKVKNMLNDITIVLTNKSGKEQIWRKWKKSIEQALESEEHNANSI